MAKDNNDFDAPKDTEPLYAWWLDLIGSWVGASTAAIPEDASDDPMPFPVGQVSQALHLTQQLLGPLYQGYFQSLLANPEPGKAFVAFQELMHEQLKKSSDALGGLAQTLAAPQSALSAGNWNLMKAPMEMFGKAVGPLSLNLERAYGGLADAFGLASSREWRGAGREMAAATLEKQQAQAEYLSLVVGAMAKGSEGVLARLKAKGEKGETIDSLLGLVRLWSYALDESMHAALQSPKALEASARLIRASSRARLQKQRMVVIASESLNIPTRAEVDDAYREIQELKREVRRLRKSMSPAPAPALPTKAATAVAVRKEPASKTITPQRTRARAPAAKRKKPLKVTTS
jgi:class III poly(R)-hydroxyalkanoic acid synthase PhaE subunit